MNTSLLHAEQRDEPTSRYGQFRLGEGDLVVYDRENADAWVRIAPSASLEA